MAIEPKRKRTEREQIPDGVAQEQRLRPLALPCCPLLHFEGHGIYSKADPGHEPTKEAIALGTGLERLDDLAVEQLEVAGTAEAGTVAGQAGTHQSIEDPSRGAIREAFLAALRLDAIDHIGPALPEAHELPKRAGGCCKSESSKMAACPRA